VTSRDLLKKYEDTCATRNNIYMKERE